MDTSFMLFNKTFKLEAIELLFYLEISFHSWSDNIIKYAGIFLYWPQLTERLSWQGLLYVPAIYAVEKILVSLSLLTV